LHERRARPSDFPSPRATRGAVSIHVIIHATHYFYAIASRTHLRGSRLLTLCRAYFVRSKFTLTFLPIGLSSNLRCSHRKPHRTRETMLSRRSWFYHHALAEGIHKRHVDPCIGVHQASPTTVATQTEIYLLRSRVDLQHFATSPVAWSAHAAGFRNFVAAARM
jgi:hypothetical protein